jgi:hypothetical protein
MRKGLRVGGIMGALRTYQHASHGRKPMDLHSRLFSSKFSFITNLILNRLECSTHEIHLSYRIFQLPWGAVDCLPGFVDKLRYLPDFCNANWDNHDMTCLLENDEAIVRMKDRGEYCGLYQMEVGFVHRPPRTAPTLSHDVQHLHESKLRGFVCLEIR